MSDTPTNHFSKKCEILADLWLNYKDDEQLQDFFEYNDIGIPLGYAIAEELAKPTEIGVRYVEETYALLLESLELPDVEFTDVEEMFAESQWQVEDKQEDKE
jgi:hypothetical protein